jgi:Ca2+-binding RTX toxin-like protein
VSGDIPSAEGKIKVPKLEDGVLMVEGTKASDAIVVRLQPGRTDVVQVDLGNGAADFNFARQDVAQIAVEAGGGDDVVRIDETGGTFTDTIPTTIEGEGGADSLFGSVGPATLDGGAGDDSLFGGRGGETLVGGSGSDVVDGNQGADVALLGSGDDTFVWDPGDGSDSVEGQGGADTLRFNGSNIGERVELSANGGRLRLVRDVAAVTMDTAGVERVDFNALGGADVVTVDDLSGTDVRQVNVDESATPGSGLGDGQADQVIVRGTDGNDRIDVSGDAGAVDVRGLAATVSVLHPEPAQDRLDVDTLAGKDAVRTDGLAAGVIQLFVDGTSVP